MCKFYVCMGNISFTSRIRMVSNEEFAKATHKLPYKKFVDFPWTIRQSVISDCAYTTGVRDCTVCGLTNGDKVLLMHISPVEHSNKNFNKIENFVKNKFGFYSDNLRGFVLGSKPNNFDSPKSTNLFEKFVSMMQKYNIPFSQFKGGNFEHDVAYFVSNDEWLIGNCVITDGLKEIYKAHPEDLCSRIFEKISLSQYDKIMF